MNNAEVKVAVEGQETERAVQLSPQKKNVDKARILFILATVGPAFVLFILFVIFPVFSMWYNSMVEWDGIGEKVFVWFDNYKVLFEDETFWKSFTNTLFLIAVVTVRCFLRRFCPREKPKAKPFSGSFSIFRIFCRSS